MRAIIDLTGKMMGQLFIVGRNGYLLFGKRKVIAWKCLCGCGETTTVSGDHLRSGHTQSCGCLSDKTKHGFRYHPLYSVWCNMQRRCGNYKGTTKIDKKNYIDRGITVCEEWCTFDGFLKWAKDKWNKGLCLDRENNNNNYTPENCRFVTSRVNSQNSVKSKRWFICGIEYASMPEAAEALNISINTVGNWCDGYIRKGRHYPPKKDCFSTKFY